MGPGGWLMMILALRMAMQCFLLSQIHITSLLTIPHQSDLKTQIKTARYLSIFLSIKKSGFSLAFGCLSLRETPKNSKWENQSNNRIVIVFEMQEKFNYLMEIFNIHILCRKILFLNYWQLDALKSRTSALFQVFDLHKNCLEKLPEDIGQLKNLKVSLWQHTWIWCNDEKMEESFSFTRGKTQSANLNFEIFGWKSWCFFFFKNEYIQNDHHHQHDCENLAKHHDRHHCKLYWI